MGHQRSFSVVLGSIGAAACTIMLGVVHSVKSGSGGVSNKRLMSELRSVASFLWRKHTIKKKPLHFVAIGER